MSLGLGLYCKEAESWAIHPPEGCKQWAQAQEGRSKVEWAVWPVQWLRGEPQTLSSLSSSVHSYAFLSFQRIAPWGERHCMERCSHKGMEVTPCYWRCQLLQ